MKLVLIVRTDLKMGCGKIAAQCSHATLSCYEKLIDTNPDILETWEHQGQPKIVLRVGSYDEMLKLSDKAKSLGLVNSIIHDAGHTQVAEGTATVLGIGPGLASEIDRVSGDLRLFP
ncbi:Peptidyl-tRNA hydrolase 2 isoform 1 [Schistosoma japonicum]|nr:Peptidyl-tRNA hydrolase 2, mitochondrial [Schistosoma japonicum]TNN18816.1 Peptidyl-tRNA hydrolase 2 isoform 1 [Schistosoma japonicum]